MQTDLSKNFEPQGIEEKWYSHWLSKGYFNSQPDDRQPYTIVIPPPNVTGVLHMGHTLNETIQDVLVRKARMSGFNACWVPGSDHASIATEAKVVQMLEKEKGIHKRDISREEFMKYAFEWKDKYGGIIYQQIKKLGCSVDWNRVTFTMDEHYYKAVIKVFVDLYNKGLIYRGARIINWDPEAQTALSDEEVEHRETQGKLFYVHYAIDGSDEHIVIATQRPETIMGDTAICVNPADQRFAHLKGKQAIIPLVNRKVPIIFDEYVDAAFGTGALKVTPAHDINDYNLGLKHNLPVVDTLNADGTLSEAAEVFVGLDRFEARKKVVEHLSHLHLLEKTEEYTTRIGFSQRTNAVVEPRISTQWFLKMPELAGKALEAVTSGNIKLHPEERFLSTYKYWLENIRDWCISRQLWWGQRIPAWYDENGGFVVAETEEEAKAQIESNTLHFENSAANKKQFMLTQDEDVLDTWFSSWLWPMEVFKGITEPNNPDIRYYYPTSVLVTGQDIIFFWVARMIMAGEEFMVEKPFSHVYFTGMVRDKQGRKMSKQLGNSPDLLQLIERFGADAVRFGILIAAPAGNDLLFDESSCDQGRNFNNKIWNALKLVKMWEARQTQPDDKQPTNFAVDWFEKRLWQVKDDVEELYRNFKLSEALKTVYSLIWDDFCSWYLEWVKPEFEQPINSFVYEKTVSFFDTLLLMLHPFMPFITEEVYHQLKPREEGDDLTIRQGAAKENNLASNEMSSDNVLDLGSLLQKSITAIRDARIKAGIKPKEKVNLHVQTVPDGNYHLVEFVLARQVNAAEVNYVTEAVSNAVVAVVGTHKFYIEGETEVDFASQKEKLQKELNYHKGFLHAVEKKFSNERFVQNAKPEVVETERKKQSDAQEKIKAIEESLASL